MIKTKTAIIVAGGKGIRMQADIPKQFLELNGKPILMHTLEVFHCCDPHIQLILVLPSSQIDFWNDLCDEYSFTLKHQIVVGGQNRFTSVKNALDSIHGRSLVAVHDGVRPLVSIDTITRCFDESGIKGTAIPVIDLVDSIRLVTVNGNQSVDRSSYKLVQTPQVFDIEILKNAYNQDFSPLFTDDASVVEASGVTINMVEGNRENIKITSPFDLEMAEWLLKSQLK